MSPLALGKLPDLTRTPIVPPALTLALRTNSRYATLENRRAEINEAEAMMRREGIRWLSTTTKSIEEIATTIL